MSCGEREVVAAGTVGKDGHLKIPVSARMRGSCTLYAFAGRRDQFQVDMYLFFTTSDYCPSGDYSLKADAEEIRVFRQLTLGLRAKPNSLALLHIYDKRLESLVGEGMKERRQPHKQYWDFQVQVIWHMCKGFANCFGISGTAEARRGAALTAVHSKSLQPGRVVRRNK
jgi:hypothetical protein